MCWIYTLLEHAGNSSCGTKINKLSVHKSTLPHSELRHASLMRRRQWHPTPVLLPGKSHGQRSSGRLQSMGSLRVGHDWATSVSLFSFMHWRRKWQPTPVFLPGEPQGRGSLVGCRLWGRTVGHDWSDLAAAAAVWCWEGLGAGGEGDDRG